MADDGGTGFNTRFTYKVPSGAVGTYYLAAGSNTPSGTGTYRVRLTDVTLSITYSLTPASTTVDENNTSITFTVTSAGDFPADTL